MINGKSVLAVIPARLKSVRFPEKPLKKILNKPMIQWVYENTKKCSLIDKLVVATDSEKIVETVDSFGGKAVMTSACCQSGSDRIVEVVDKYETGFDIIVNVQGDEPLIKPLMLEELIMPFNDETVEVVTLGTHFKTTEDIKNFNYVKIVIDKFSNALYFSRNIIPYNREGSIDIKNYIKHIGVYAFTKKTLLNFSEMEVSKLEKIEKLEQLRFLENGIKIKVSITALDTVGVDTLEDLKKVEDILKNQ